MARLAARDGEEIGPATGGAATERFVITTTITPTGVTHMPLEVIDAGTNVRDLNEAHVAALADSIALRGLLVPLIVRPAGERFELVAGHHRLAACRKLDLQHVEVTVRDRHRVTQHVRVLQLGGDAGAPAVAAEQIGEHGLPDAAAGTVVGAVAPAGPERPDIDAGPVARLIAAQFPRWAHLPIHPVTSAGTVNALQLPERTGLSGVAADPQDGVREGDAQRGAGSQRPLRDVSLPRDEHTPVIGTSTAASSPTA